MKPNDPNGWLKNIWPAAAAGVLLVTVPGFYIGKVCPWYRSMNLVFWLTTLLLVVALVFIFKKIWVAIRRADANAPVQGSRPWQLFLLPFLTFAMGYYLAGSLWWTAGNIVLAFAKSDVLSAGFQVACPEKSPVLQDAKNAVVLFNQAWNAPSMRKLGVVSALFDKPPQGRFEENAKIYAYRAGLEDLSPQPFWGKKTENEFMQKFISDAMAGVTTREEKTYAHKFLKEHEDALGLIGQAFQAKGVDWGVDFNVEPSWDIPFPRIAYYLSLARLLRTQALILALDGDAAGSVRSLQTGLFLGDTLRLSHTLIAEMIDTAIVRMMSSTVCAVLPQLEVKGHAGEELLPYLRSDRLENGFYTSMQWELFGYTRSFESIGWLDFANNCKTDGFYFGFGGNEAANYLMGLMYRPFLLFDMASSYEYKIQLMKVIETNSGDWDKGYQAYQRNGWLLGLYALPRFAQMGEKVREALTICNQARIEVEIHMFHRKYKRFPATAEELEKWCLDNWNPLSGVQDPLPKVETTAAFVPGAKSPAGN